MGVLIFGDRTFTDTFMDNSFPFPVLGLGNDLVTATELLKTVETGMVVVGFPGQEGIEFAFQSADLYRDRRFFLAIDPSAVTPSLWSRAKAMAVTLVNRDTALMDISRQSGAVSGALTRREPVDLGEIYRAENEYFTGKTLGKSFRTLRQQKIVLWSSKGGAGKTAVSCNVAAAVAMWAKSMGLDYRAVLIDSDVGGSKTARYWLGAGETPGGLSAFAVGRGVLPRSAINSMVMHHPSGLDYILAPRSATEGNKIEREVMARVLSNMSRYYGLVVCDLGSSLFEYAVEAMQQASLIILVAEPELPTIKDLKEFVSIAGREHKLNLASMRLVVNKYDPRLGFSPQEMQAEIGVPLLGFLPEDISVKKLLNTGEGVLSVEKDLHSPFSKSVISLAQAIIGHEMFSSDQVRKNWLKKLFEWRPQYGKQSKVKAV